MKTIPSKALATFQELTDIIESTLRYDSFDYSSYFSLDVFRDIQRYRLNHIKKLVNKLYCQIDTYLDS